MKRFLAFFILPLLLAVIPIWHLPTHAATLDQIRLSFQHDPKTTMTVMWRTEGNLTPRVQYGPTPAYGSETVGTTQPAVLDGYFYNTVELTDLTPNTTYHYRISGDLPTGQAGGGIWSNNFIFKTAPSGAADFSFTVFGDNGLDTMSGGNPRRIKDLVLAQNPTLHLIAGDLTYADSESNKKSAWEQWFTEMGRISETIPIIPALGNHERSSSVKFSNGELFYTRSFALPSEHNEEYYSFDYGDLHFTIINSDEYSSLRPGRAQYEWIRADLAATTKRFKIAVFHHMAYSSGSRHSVLQDVQNNLSPLFDEYNVDLVFTGHNHQYERTYPLRYGSFNNPVVATTGNAYINPDATVYIVTGGGGRSSYDFENTQPAWSAYRCKCNEIVRVDVDDVGVLNVRTIDTNGTTIDQFSIDKTGSPTSAIIPPAPLPINQPQPTYPLTSVPTTQTIRGFNFAVWWHDILDKESTHESIRKMTETGANYFGLAPFWYQDHKTSAVIYRRDSKTATDSSVRSAIRYAKSVGLKIALKPMVDSRDNTWRGEFQPSNSDAWFQSYKDFILTFARIAQEEGVDYLIIGTEFTKLTKPQYSQKWREIIRDIRVVYSGPLTYAANWGKRDDGEYYQIDFWDALDAIGIDAYFPLAENDNPTAQSVANAWTTINSGGTQNWYNDINELRTRFDKPVLFTEIGDLSCDGAGKKPGEYPCGRNLDLQEQADLYEGTLRFWADKSWMQGFLFWRWDADQNKGGTSDKDYLVAGKPVIEVLKNFWTIPVSSAPASPPPPVIPPDPGGGMAGSPAPNVSTVSEHTPTLVNAPSSGGGGGSGIPPPISAVTTFPQTPVTPTVNQHSSIIRESLVTHSRVAPFAYGKPRIAYPAAERAKAWELSLALRKIFNGIVPMQKKHWYLYANAYIYGDYPPNVVAQSLRIGGKVVHLSIPYTAWRRSRDFQKYMR